MREFMCEYEFMKDDLYATELVHSDAVPLVDAVH